MAICSHQPYSPTRNTKGKYCNRSYFNIFFRLLTIQGELCLVELIPVKFNRNKNAYNKLVFKMHILILKTVKHDLVFLYLPNNYQKKKTPRMDFSSSFLYCSVWTNRAFLNFVGLKQVTFSHFPLVLHQVHTEYHKICHIIFII